MRPAGIDRPADLIAAFRGCDAVINCAGPFLELGQPVVRAAIAAGCHYVDTSAEQMFVKGVFDDLSADAERSGVTVVPATGYDVVPADLLAHATAGLVAPVSDLVIAYDVQGFDMTRGTLRSAFAMLTGGQLSYVGGEWRSGEPPTNHTSVAFPGNAAPTPVMNWPGCEIVTVPHHVQTRQLSVVINASAATPEFFQLLQMPADTVAEIVDALPEGPAEARRPAAAFTIVADAVGSEGRRARGVLHGRDIYGCTAVIAVEAVRRLLSQPVRSGVLAPSEAYGVTDFLNFLVPYGFSWNVETLRDAPSPA